MLLAEVEYVRPTTIEDAVRLLSAHDGARALASGQTLTNVMKARAAAPDVLIDLNGLEPTAPTIRAAAEAEAATNASVTRVCGGLPSGCSQPERSRRMCIPTRAATRTSRARYRCTAASQTGFVWLNADPNAARSE